MPFQSFVCSLAFIRAISFQFISVFEWRSSRFCFFSSSSSGAFVVCISCIFVFVWPCYRLSSSLNRIYPPPLAWLASFSRFYTFHNMRMRVFVFKLLYKSHVRVLSHTFTERKNLFRIIWKDSYKFIPSIYFFLGCYCCCCRCRFFNFLLHFTSPPPTTFHITYNFALNSSQRFCLYVVEKKVLRNADIFNSLRTFLLLVVVAATAAAVALML